MKKLSCALLGGLVILAVNAGQAIGIPAFKKQFEERYIGENEDSPMAVSFGEAKCYTCHVPGEKKEVNNAYGIALSELLDKEDFKRDRLRGDPEGAEAEIRAALEAVESLESPTGDTYLERIEANLLPIEFVPAPEDDE